MNMNINPFLNNLKNQSFNHSKINATFHLISKTINKTDNEIFVNLILDDDITIKEMMLLFFKRIGREDWINQNKLKFLYNAELIDINDQRKLKDLNRNENFCFHIQVHYFYNL